jgi:broad-specificity NMP kinase
MSFIYITGIAGSGKSVVCKELVSRGYEAHECDAGLSGFYNKITGERLLGDTTPEERTLRWREIWEWRMSRDKIAKLKARATDKPVFVCGVAGNEDECMDLFDKVFALVIDEVTLVQRIKSRTNNNFGKSDHEFAGILEWQKIADENYKSIGAINVDATKPIREVVDYILRRVRADSL